MINKVDRAAAKSLTMLHAKYPDAVFVSARTEWHRSTTRNHRVASAAAGDRDSCAIPYERGDLVNSIHQTGEFCPSIWRRHAAVVARVSPSLAGELAPYELVSSDSARRDAR